MDTPASSVRPPSRGESILSAVILGHGGAHEDLSLLTSWTFSPLATVAIALGEFLYCRRADARASRIACRRVAPAGRRRTG